MRNNTPETRHIIPPHAVKAVEFALLPIAVKILPTTAVIKATKNNFISP